MKIIQTQSRALIARFHKIIIWLLILCVIVFVISSYLNFRKFEYNCINYKNVEEVITIFENNRADFDMFVKILNETEVIEKLEKRYLAQKKITYPTGDSMSNPKKQLCNFDVVSKDQYDYICGFYDKYGPYTTDIYDNCYEITFITEENHVVVCRIAEDLGNSNSHFFSTQEKMIDLRNGWYYKIIAY